MLDREKALAQFCCNFQSEYNEIIYFYTII